MISARLDVLVTASLLLSLLSVFISVASGDNRLVSSPEGLFAEEKFRLGSVPPSCYNRCNACNPCIAVQVPTLPIHSNELNGAVEPLEATESFNQYSNYKPLGWKCRCGARLFNP